MISLNILKQMEFLMDAQRAFCELELYFCTVFRQMYGCKGNWICCMQYRLQMSALCYALINGREINEL